MSAAGTSVSKPKVRFRIPVPAMPSYACHIAKKERESLLEWWRGFDKDGRGKESCLRRYGFPLPKFLSTCVGT